MLSKTPGSVLLTLAMLLGSQLATAQVITWGEEYARRLKSSERVAPLKGDLFGESISLFNGTVSFNVTDVSVPGNSGLSVAIGRRLDSSTWGYEGRHFGTWELDIPRLTAVSAVLSQDLCSVGAYSLPEINLFYPFEYWGGIRLEMPGGGGGELLRQPIGPSAAKLVKPQDGVSYPWVTKGMWYFSCQADATGHEAFIGLSPDGTRYTFDRISSSPDTQLEHPGMGGFETLQRNRYTLYPSRVEDRFGNWVSYEWGNAGSGWWGGPVLQLRRIHSSDGREITVQHDRADVRGKISVVTAHGRTWTYQYPNGQLSTVTHPDGGIWRVEGGTPQGITFVGPGEGGLPTLDRTLTCSFMPVIANPNLEFAAMAITLPSGARGEFSFRPIRHGRTGVPMSCQSPWWSEGGGQDSYWNASPVYQDVHSLVRKRVTGPGLPEMSWQYEYTNLAGGYAYPASTYPNYKFVTIRKPDGASDRLTFGKDFARNEGQLITTENLSASGEVLRTITNTYVTDAEAAQAAFPEVVGYSQVHFSDSFSTAAQRPVRTTVTHQQGVSFSDTVSQFDAFARPTVSVKSSALGTRTESTQFHDDLAAWVIGQSRSVTQAGVEVERVDYDARNLPWKRYAFGQLQHTFTYHADGTLATVKDGRNLVTTLSDWHRGLPRTIQFADGTSQSATVNPQGWITSTTDENGFTNSYAYDAAGRMTLMTPPAGDTVAWLPTSISFTRATAAAYGLPVGHWKTLVSRGSYRQETYYDALYRPRMTREYDTTNEAGTRRVSVVAYSLGGETSFTSYPVSDAATVSTPLNGVWTEYDALGRLVSSSQDSELGVLTTLHEYISGFQTRVRNPRGHSTVTQYQAFGHPSLDAPTGITQSDVVVTEIARDDLGRTRSLKRRSVDGTIQLTRHYVYDPNGRLCKTIEPETGATVMEYDPAGNLAWTAGGLALPGADPSSCPGDRTAAYSSGRRVDRGYDARNRLVALTFPDGNGNQTWTYTPDGLPASITTANVGQPNHTVINSYGYNRRRLLTSETSAVVGWYTWTLGYGYDSHGHLASHTYPTGLHVAYAPNALGQATQAGSYATGVQYHPNGAIKQFSYGNGLLHTMVQNARQLPARSTDTGGALDHAYSYDGNGNVVATIDHNSGTRSRWMAYDSLDRLTDAGSAVFGGDHWHRFSYDALDNLRSWKLAGVKDYGNYVYDSGNRLTQIRSSGDVLMHTLNYDVQGNLASKNGTSYQFDFGNRLRSVSLGGSSERYAYDGHGRRVWVSTSMLINKMMYSNSGQLLFSSKIPAGGTQTTHENVYLSGSLVAIIDHDWPSNVITSLKYQHTDALGSPVAMSDSAGIVVDRTDYDPYGGAINEVIDGIGYTGHVMDPTTGLTYMQQRYYDPAIGRFLSVDPVRAHRGSGANFNRYRYAANNPYRFTDPDGRLQKDKIESPLPPPPPTLPPVEVTAPKPAAASTSISIPMPIPASPVRLPKINVTAPRPAPWFLLLVWPSELGAPACEMPGGPPCGLGVYNESEPSEKELTKVKESDANKVAQDARYEDAHDAKKGRGEGGVDIYRDRSGRHWLRNGVPGGGKEEL